MLNATGADASAGLVIERQRHEPLLVHRPPTAADTWVIMVHAPAENRTGTNFWQVQTAEQLAAAGIGAARFDLVGYGESLADMDVDIWHEQVREAVETAHTHGASTVHVTARGLHAELLADLETTGDRVALFPPDASSLTGWESVLGSDAAGPLIRVTAPLPEADREFWEACGAEYRLLGGCHMLRAALAWLVQAAIADEGERWDVTVASASSAAGRPNRIVGAHDPLTRLESDRHGLAALLARHAAGHLATRDPRMRR
jgi:hypothetical protein